MENQDGRAAAAPAIGRYLRDKRMSRNITLDEVSQSTGISTAVLQALEDDDRAQLPAEIYIRAFYKKYGGHLGMDPAEIEEKYRQQSPGVKKTRHKAGFNTVITIKGQEENVFAEILRRLFLPLAVLVLGVLLFWLYTNYLAPYNPLGFYQENLPALFSCLPFELPEFFS